jgi:hypothetical protein
LKATILAWHVQQFPLGAAGVNVIPPLSSSYTCTTTAGAGASITAAGCTINVPPGAVAEPRVDTINVTMTLGSYQQGVSISIFRPALALSIGSAALRRLALGCSSFPDPIYQSTKLLAKAVFVHPDDSTQQLHVDITRVADLAVDPSAVLQVEEGVVQGLAPVADATIALAAAAPGSPASVRVSVLDEDTCIDALVPVVTSGAQLQLLSRSASNVTVQLQVQQRFADPDDRGVVAVYAEKGIASYDVTSQVCNRSNEGRSSSQQPE